MLRMVQSRMAEKLEALGEVPRKVVEFAAVFTFLGSIYTYYLKSRMESAGGVIAVDATLLLALLKFFALTGGPLAVVTWLDARWRDQDTAIVCLAAYFASNIYWAHRIGCAPCVFAMAYMLVPHF